jgi:hypothetical protein
MDLDETNQGVYAQELLIMRFQFKFELILSSYKIFHF